MNEFEKIQELWQNQPSAPTDSSQIVQLAKKQKHHSTKKHIAGILVMGITSLVVLILWIFGAVSPALKLGFSLMFGSIFSRTLLEYFSFRQLRKINPLDAPESYRKRIIKFYRLRKILMSVVTAIAVVLYVSGFLLMLPDFKENLSHGMYIYIVVFLIIALPLSAYLLYRQAKREFSDLSAIIELLQ